MTWLLGRAASYQQTRGNPRAAPRLFQRADPLDRDGLGADHADPSPRPTDLAHDMRALGDHQQARHPHRRPLVGPEAAARLIPLTPVAGSAQC